jgi:hypothetical protein
LHVVYLNETPVKTVFAPIFDLQTQLIELTLESEVFKASVLIEELTLMNALKIEYPKLKKFRIKYVEISSPEEHNLFFK